MTALLQAKGVTKRFGGVLANDGVDLDVHEGEIVGLIGPNGAGKTTLFNMLGGVRPAGYAPYPDAGKVWFRGQEITRMPAHRICHLGIGRAFQIVQIFNDMTVLDNVGIGAWSSGSVPGSRIVMEQQYNTAFSEEEADVNIVTAGFFAIAELITRDELAAGHASPMLGGARFYLNDEVTRLYHIGDAIADLGFGWAPLENQVCRTSFFEENTEVCKVYHDAKNEAMQILHDDPVGVITQSDKYIENLGVQNAEEAEFTVEYNINLNNPFTDLEPPKHPAVYSEYALTDEWIENDKKFLDKVAEIGMTDPNWADYVSYEKL
jgi:ABC-type Fe3+/spermidine/putrescine transport system ATPase subunit